MKFNCNHTRTELSILWNDYLEHDNPGIGDIYHYEDNNEYGDIFTYEFHGYIYCITMEFMPGKNNAYGDYIPGHVGRTGIIWNCKKAGKYAMKALEHLSNNWYEV